MSKKRWESAAHIAMGFFAGLLNLRLLLSLREWRQLPPENDRYPVIWVDLSSDDTTPWAYLDKYVDASGKSLCDEYWSKARVLDTLSDSWEYRIGETAAWFVRTGLIGWLLYLAFR